MVGSFQAYKAPPALSSHPSITGARTAALKSTWMTIALSVSIQTSTVAMTCATDYDAIRICTSDSHEYVYDRDVPDDVVFNGFNVDYVFSNRQAAINRGNLYRVVPWAETEEPIFLEPAFHDVRHVVWAMVEFDAKTSARMSIFSPRQAWADCYNDIFGRGDSVACVAIECEGTFNPQMANVQGQCDIAYNVNESVFTDAMFDEFVGDVANTPAPYLDGVLINLENHPIQTR